jgi:hypothetical protein
MPEEIPFKLYPFQQKMIDELTEGEFNCLECNMRDIKRNGRGRVGLITGCGKPYWMWFCVPCYEKRYGKRQTEVKYRTSCIAEYLEAGFTLFPCYQDKTPAKKGWNKLTFDPNFALGQYVAFGVVLGASDVVLDWDLRRDDIQASQLKEFIKLLGYTTPLKTLIVKTAGGGRHIYLKKSPSQELVYGKFAANYPAIEIKKKGHFVIGAGSVINGVQYRVIRR